MSTGKVTGARLLTTRLLLRRIQADRWVAAMAVVVVAVSTGLGLALLRHLDTVQHEGARQAAERLGPRVRDLVATLSIQPATGPVDDPERPYAQLLERVRQGPVTTVGSIAGDPSWFVRTRQLDVLKRPRPVARSYLVLGVGSGWRERVRLVSGRLPVTARPARPPMEERFGEPAIVPARLEVALADAVARPLHLQAGDQILVAGDSTSYLPPLWLDLVGTYAAADPADPFWAPQPELLHGTSTEDDDLGRIWTGTALADGHALPVLAEELMASAPVLQVRVPIQADQVRGADPEQLLSRLRTAGAVPVTYPEVTGPAGRLMFVSELDEALATYLRQRVPTLALALLLLAGLGLAALVVLGLALRLLLDRRRSTLAVTAARGTSPGQAVRQLAVEGLVLGVPGALVGWLAALAVPGSAGRTGWAALAVGLLAAALLLPAMAWPLLRVGVGDGVRRRRPVSGRPGRAPRGAVAGAVGAGGAAAAGAAAGSAAGAVAAGGRVWRPGGGRASAAVVSFRGGRRDVWSRRRRWALEGGLVALAVTAVVALHARGLAASAVALSAEVGPAGGAAGRPPAAGVDPLVLAGPTLVAAVAALVVARMLGPVLAAATGWAAGRRGAVAFLGLARAAREGTVGVAGLVAVLLALSTAALAAVTGATVEAGTTAAAWQRVGADLRVHGFGLASDQARRLARLPGVTRVTPLTTVDPATIGPAGSAGGRSATRDVTLLATDPAALAGVQQGLGPWALPPAVAADLASGSGTPVPVAVSAGLARVGQTLTLTVELRTVTVRVVAVLPRLLGAPQDGPWVLGPLDRLRAATSLALSSQDLLVAIVPGAGAPPVDRLRAVLGDVVTTRTPGDLEAAVRSSPLVDAVKAGLPVALVVGAGYAAVAIWLGVAVGGRTRSRFLAHLRALGLSSRQAGALIALEVVPAVLAAALAGPLVGALLAPTVLRAADLRPLTGATVAPQVVLAPSRLALIAAVVLAITLLAAAVAVLAGRRVSPAEASRVVEGG